MKNNKFSVLISVYGREKPHFLEAALRSVVNQSLQADEVILVEDGPLPDSLTAIIGRYKNLIPINSIQLPVNKGLGKALNVGLLSCSNRYVARMDSDDICHPDRFKLQMEYLYQHPEIDVLGCQIEEFNDLPGDTGVIRKVPESHEEIQKYAMYRSPINHPSIVFKRDVITNAGSYLCMQSFEDYYLWLRLLKLNARFHNLQISLLHFRIGNKMIKRRHGKGYAKNELAFFYKAYKENLITFKSFLISAMRFPLRLLPERLLALVYKHILR